MSRIIFPVSNLNIIAAQTIQKQPLNFFTLPKEWTHKISGTCHKPRNPTGGGGGRARAGDIENGGGDGRGNVSGNDRNNDRGNDQGSDQGYNQENDQGNDQETTDGMNNG